MWKEMGYRQEGKMRPHSFANRIRSRRAASLALSNRKEILSPHKGSINALQVDLTEGRYLLSGASDGSTAAFDVQHATNYTGGGFIAEHKPLFIIDKQHQQGHHYAISSVAWYPIDTGLFITGSFDHRINVWDTNTIQVVMNFLMPGKVYGTAMSSIASSHMLIAVGTEDVQVRLCDIASGAFTHTLSGHRDGVMALEWSTSSEWVLMTGGCDGAIRFWDIRRAGCFRVLDQSVSQLGRRPPLIGKTQKKSIRNFPDNQGLASQSLLASQSSLKTRIPPKRMGLSSSSKHFSTLFKGSGQPRGHPGLMSNRDRATAHYGSVTALKATADGMYLLSSGSDSRVRLWDIESGFNTLVNFESTRLQTSKAIQLAVTEDSSLIFVPCISTVKAFDMWSGRTMLTFSGHYDYVNCCCFNFQDQELYTGSNDRQILVWSPTYPVAETEAAAEGQMCMDRDNWSD